jgi:hypothetical protein
MQPLLIVKRLQVLKNGLASHRGLDTISKLCQERKKSRLAKSERAETPSRFTPLYGIRYGITFFALVPTELETTAPLAASPDQEYQHTWEPQTPF